MSKILAGIRNKKILIGSSNHAFYGWNVGQAPYLENMRGIGPAIKMYFVMQRSRHATYHWQKPVVPDLYSTLEGTDLNIHQNIRLVRGSPRWDPQRYFDQAAVRILHSSAFTKHNIAFDHHTKALWETISDKLDWFAIVWRCTRSSVEQYSSLPTITSEVHQWSTSASTFVSFWWSPYYFQQPANGEFLLNYSSCKIEATCPSWCSQSSCQFPKAKLMIDRLNGTIKVESEEVNKERRKLSGFD